VIRLRRKPPSTLSGALVFLDPGHGGADPGAPYVASHETLKHEKLVNLLIALKLRAKLEAAGATVFMSRTDDSTLSRAERVAMTRAKNPDLFISMHTDSTDASLPSGTTSFYFRAYGQPLASAIQKRVAEAYLTKIYVAANSASIPNYADMRTRVDRGTKYYPFEVTRIEECPAVLIEYGFGSNLTECRVLQKDEYQNVFAQATFDGILDYLKAAQ
jgi:N-acetylmuramoyl-L-alanine amidase